jgi:hypothetical protein
MRNRYRKNMMSLKAMDLQKERERGIKYDRHYWLIGCMIQSSSWLKGSKGNPVLYLLYDSNIRSADIQLKATLIYGN